MYPVRFSALTLVLHPLLSLRCNQGLDIYARMTAFSRGWRIKHAKHNQCGKERNLGFGSILQAVYDVNTVHRIVVIACGDMFRQEGSINLVPVYDWIKRWILSIFMSFLPSPLQEFTACGLIRSLIRLPNVLCPCHLYLRPMKHRSTPTLSWPTSLLGVLAALPPAADSQQQGYHSIFILWVCRTVALSEDEDTIDPCLCVHGHVVSVSGLL